MKQMRISAISILLTLILCSSALADYKKLTKQGNEAYSKKDVEQALKYYQEAEIEKPEQPILDYNIGTALYEQAKYDEALKRYGRALLTDQPEFQADTYYNMGNSFFRREGYAEAIQSYQKCLELNPNDVDAKYNLELARKKLKEQAQQQNQQQDQQQNQQNQDQQDQQQNQQDQQDQQQQEQNQNNSEEKDKQQGEQGSEGQEQEQQQQQQEQGSENEQQQQGAQGNEEQQTLQQAQEQKEGDPNQKMSKEDAQRLLRAIANQEKDLQQKRVGKQMRQTDYKSAKDW